MKKSNDNAHTVVKKDRKKHDQHLHPNCCVVEVSANTLFNLIAETTVWALGNQGVPAQKRKHRVRSRGGFGDPRLLDIVLLGVILKYTTETKMQKDRPNSFNHDTG